MKGNTLTIKVVHPLISALNYGVVNEMTHGNDKILMGLSAVK